MSVPFIDLSGQHKKLRGQLNKAVAQVLDSQHYILGDFGKKLEAIVAEKAGCKHALGVASGSDALFLSLAALGIGAGDEVITTPFTFFATAGAISRTGATPVFADIDPDTFDLDPDQIEKKISKKTKAVVPVHLYGLCCDMDPILNIARRHGLWVVEDAAQSFGAEYKGRSAGSMGTAGCFSFYPTKNFGGAGDGGMIVTSDDALAQKLRMFRQHGSSKKYFHDFIGINSRLDEIQAAVLLVKMNYIDRWNGSRRELASFYDSALKGLAVKTPKAPKGHRHIYHLYSLLTDKREPMQAFLKEQGIETGVYYPLPLHLQPCYKHLGYQKNDLPCSEAASERVLSLPMFPELTKSGARYVAKSVRAFCEASA